MLSAAGVETATIVIRPVGAAGEYGAEPALLPPREADAVVLPVSMVAQRGVVVDEQVTHVAYLSQRETEHSLPVGSKATVSGTERRIKKVVPYPQVPVLGMVTELHLGA